MNEHIFSSKGRALARCRGCGEPLYAGDTAYRLGALLICPSCMDDALIVCRPTEEAPVSSESWEAEEAPESAGFAEPPHTTYNGKDDPN